MAAARFRSWAAAGIAVALAAGMIGVGPAQAGSALKGYSDDALAKGFYATVFGLEHGSRGANIVKRYHRQIRFRVENESAIASTRRVEKFIASLPAKLPGVDARLAGPGERANFVVHIVNRQDYVARVRTIAYGGTHGSVPGSCMVKVDYGRSGIDRSDAFIVGDEGDQLFKRCMIEEILQGLGPMNDNPALSDSVFNDRSKHARLMDFDRALVAMLYDPRVRHGMSKADVDTVMPDIIASARKSVR